MLIRDFTPQDYPDYLEMASALFQGSAAAHPLPEQHFRHTFEQITGGNPALRGLILEVEGQPAGYSQLSRTYNNEIDGDFLWIEELYIKEEHRGSGLATAFFDWLVAEYTGKVKMLRLEASSSNTRAIELYKRLGFEEWPYIQMAKKL